MKPMNRTGNSVSRTGRDRGATLIELLVSVVLTGVIVSTVSMALILILRTQQPTEWRISESNDVSFVQTWLPQDLSSATELDKHPTAQLPGVPGLPGTNVVTMRRPIDGPGGGQVWVSYRYVQRGDEWHLIRYQADGDGSATSNTVARSLPSPPDGWTPDEPAHHAVEVTARNQIVLRPVGENVEVKFRSGESFTTGGGGMSAENELPPGASGGLVDPAAPPSRCGRTMTLVLDTSGSVPIDGGDGHLKTASVGFIDAFTGTPSRVSVLGFDRAAYAMTFWPAAGGTPTNEFLSGLYVDLLNDSDELQNARLRILALDDWAGRSWPGGWMDAGLPAPSFPVDRGIDRDGDGIHFDQIAGGTNWEDGLLWAFADTHGNLHAQLPELVVFITDGVPNFGNRVAGVPAFNRNDAISMSGNLARDRAVTVANLGRDTGARVIGIFVGPRGNNSARSNLKAVVGHNEWNGSGPGDVGNAATADFFGSSFADLGDVLRAIMVAECGGTVTLQKRVEVGGELQDPGGVWSYTTEIGVRELDRSREAAITFDYVFQPGETFKDIQISEAPVDGYTFDRAECSSFGQPLPPHSTWAPDDGSPGVVVRMQPDQAVSCLMVSSPS